jgi:hypothetical protein
MTTFARPRMHAERKRSILGPIVPSITSRSGEMAT